jgi:Transposase IS66 family
VITAPPFDVFDFTMCHKRDGPSQFLAGFRGFLQADAFGGYDGIYAGGDVVEVGCNAHARRKFIEAQASDAARSAAALAHYRALHAIEKEIKAEIAQLPPDADEATRAAIRLRVRQEKAVSVWEDFETWPEAERSNVLPKSPLGGALGYMRNNREALKRYTVRQLGLPVDRQQCVRATHEDNRDWTEKLAVHGECGRRLDDGHPVQRGVELPASRARPVRVPARRADAPARVAEGAAGRSPA